MAREVLVTCDVGGEPDAKLYTFTDDGETWEIELCEKHAAPIERLKAKGRKRMATATPIRGRRSVNQLESRVRGIPPALSAGD